MTAYTPLLDLIGAVDAGADPKEVALIMSAQMKTFIREMGLDRRPRIEGGFLLILEGMKKKAQLSVLGPARKEP